MHCIELKHYTAIVYEKQQQRASPREQFAAVTSLLVGKDLSCTFIIFKMPDMTHYFYMTSIIIYIIVMQVVSPHCFLSSPLQCSASNPSNFPNNSLPLPRPVLNLAIHSPSVQSQPSSPSVLHTASTAPRDP